MPIKINQNIISTLIRRNLDKANAKLQTSFERLSSGERIQRAADDPTGLSNSQQLRYEIRGLQKNVQNVGGTLSLIGTAETGITNVQNYLQRARELAVQAGNETLAPAQRAAIQTELDQILAEIDRLGSETNYLGRPLLDGSFIQQVIQVGAQTGQTLGLSLRDYRTAALGQVAEAIGAAGVNSTGIIGGGDLTINGVNVPASVSDGLSSAFPAASALAKARAINGIESQTGVHATAEPTVHLAAGASVSGVFIDGVTNSLTINGVNVNPIVVVGGDADGALVNAINAVKSQTGVTASLDISGSLKLTAADGRNIAISTTGSVADELGLSAANGDLTNALVTAQIRLSSDQPFGVGGSLALIGFGAGQASTGLSAATALGGIEVSSAAAATDAIRRIDAAMRQTSSDVAVVGSLQNRMEGLAEQLGRRIEDLSAADSRIRDADVALESARLAQAQVLQEAATSLLTQANVTPATVLRLLQ